MSVVEENESLMDEEVCGKWLFDHSPRTQSQNKVCQVWKVLCDDWELKTINVDWFLDLVQY